MQEEPHPTTYIPTGRGFDTSFGYFSNYNDYYTEVLGKCNSAPTCIVDLWDTDEPAAGVNGTGPDDYEEALFVEHLMQVVDNHDPSKPLFLYYAPHIAHGPLQVPDRYVQKFSFIDDQRRQYYHTMVEYLDGVVGNFTNALKKHSLWDNLFFVTSSDNGGPLTSANNYP